MAKHPPRIGDIVTARGINSGKPRTGELVAIDDDEAKVRRLDYGYVLTCRRRGMTAHPQETTRG